MTIINMMAINEAPFIQVQNITIHRTTTIPVNIDILNKDSLNVLIQEFEARRLYVDNVAGLFEAAGHILNADGTGSDGLVTSLADASMDDITGLPTALSNKLETSLKGNINGLAELDSTGKVPSGQLPSYVDDVESYDTLALFPITGEDSKIYVAKNANITYRWSGTAYVAIGSDLALGETSSTAYRGDMGKTAYDHSQTTHDKAFVGLGNVDNTSDIDKPVSTAQATAIGFKVTANTAITGATKTKITYDAKGLVTSGADAAIADITGLQTALDAKIAGPAVAVDNSIARFDGITGKVIQDGSLCYIDDTGKMGINVVSPAASLDIKGLGATSATKSLIVKNSADTNILTACDCGAVGINNASPVETLDIIGTIKTTPNTGTTPTYLNLCSYTSGTVTGMIAIKFPTRNWNRHMKLEISGYTSRVLGGWDLSVAMLAPLADTWSSASCEASGNPPFSFVKACKTSTDMYLILGTTSTVWTNPHIIVKSLELSGGTYSGMSTGWTMSLLTSDLTYTSTKTVVYNNVTLSRAAISDDSRFQFVNRNASFMLDGELINYGWETMTAVTTKMSIVKNVTSPNGQGALRFTGGFCGWNELGNEYIAVNGNDNYEAVIDLLNPTTNIATNLLCYFFMISYDAEKILMAPECIINNMGSPVVLARDLQVGDTAIYGKTNGMGLSTATYQRRFIGWKKQSDGTAKYTALNGLGKTYNHLEYTRIVTAQDIWANNAGAFQQPYVVTQADLDSGLWDSDITLGQTVYKTTLTTTVNTTTFWYLDDIRTYGLVMNKGDTIAQGSGGSAYNYFASIYTPKSDTWTTTTTPIRSGFGNGSSLATALWNGTNYVKLGTGLIHPSTTGYNTTDIYYLGRFGLRQIPADNRLYNPQYYRIPNTTTNTGIIDAATGNAHFSGNMRIGNTTDVADAKLDIKGSGATSVTTSLLVKNSSGVESLRVLDNGYLGMGTTPSSRFQIEANTNGSDGVYIRNSNTGTAANTFISVASNAGSATHRTYSTTHSVWASRTILSTDSGIINGLTLLTGTTSPIELWTNSTQRMTINGTGNVGINEASPTAKLDINSDILRLRTAKTPASATAIGNAGDICWDASYVYVCTATNTWKRSAIATW